MLGKMVVAILLMGFALRLVFFRSTRLSPILEATPIAKKSVLPISNLPVSVLPISNPPVPVLPIPNPPALVPVHENENENGDHVPPNGN